MDIVPGPNTPCCSVLSKPVDISLQYLGQIHLVVEGVERSDLLRIVPFPLGILRLALLQCLLLLQLLLQFLLLRPRQVAPFPLCSESRSGVDPVVLLLPPPPAMRSLEGIPGLVLRPPLLGHLLEADCRRALQPLPLDLPSCQSANVRESELTGTALAMRRPNAHARTNVKIGIWLPTLLSPPSPGPKQMRVCVFALDAVLSSASCTLLSSSCSTSSAESGHRGCGASSSATLLSCSFLGLSSAWCPASSAASWTGVWLPASCPALPSAPSPAS